MATPQQDNGMAETPPGAEQPKLKDSSVSSSETLRSASDAPVSLLDSEAADRASLALMQSKISLENKLTRLKEQHHQAEQEIVNQLVALARMMDLTKERIDVNLYNLGATTIEVQGSPSRLSPSRQSAMTKVIKDLCQLPYDFYNAERAHLRNGWYGTRDYGHDTGLECQCLYDFNPRHGTVVFRIGLSLFGRSLAMRNQFDEAWARAAIYYIRVVMMRGRT